jgi:hypothetical protein
VFGSTSFNSAAQLALFLQFDDASSGIFIASVPEPAAVLPLCALTLMTLSLRRHGGAASRS